jgi:hypothetical protein
MENAMQMRLPRTAAGELRTNVGRIGYSGYACKTIGLISERKIEMLIFESQAAGQWP